MRTHRSHGPGPSSHEKGHLLQPSSAQVQAAPVFVSLPLHCVLSGVVVGLVVAVLVAVVDVVIVVVCVVVRVVVGVVTRQMRLKSPVPKRPPPT